MQRAFPEIADIFHRDQLAPTYDPDSVTDPFNHWHDVR